MPLVQSDEYVLLDSIDPGYSQAVDTKKADIAILTITTEADFKDAVFVWGSYAEEAPNFSHIKTFANEYSALNIVDLEDGNNYPGDTGVVYPGGALTVRSFEINVNAVAFICVQRTSVLSPGKRVAVKLRLYNLSAND